MSFKSNKKPIEKEKHEFKKKWASTGEQPPRKFSIRRKRSKEDDFCMEYRKHALEILEKETPVKVQKLKNSFLNAAFENHFKHID